MPASSHSRAVRFWLIRHAPLINRHDGFPDAQGDADLSGKAVLNLLATALPAEALWVTSPWPRARQTAEALWNLSGGSTTTIALEERFSEQNFGLWAGMSHAQAARSDPDLYQRFWEYPAKTAPPQGESFAAQIKRVKAALSDLIEHHTHPSIPSLDTDTRQKTHHIQGTIKITDTSPTDPATDIIIVAHAGTIRAALAIALACSEHSALHFHLECLSLTRLDYWAGEGPDSSTGWKVDRVNHHPALPSPSSCRSVTPKPATTLVLGGIRSGKSAHAESVTLQATGKNQTPIYIATADPALSAADPQMRHRIEDHRQRRGNRWRLIEEPDHVPACIATLIDDQTAPILVDSISIWLANRITKNGEINAEINQLCQVLTQTRGPIILVADEVGLGGVAAHPTARAFADHAGGLNTRLAALCDQVILVTAGLVTTLKA